LNIAKFPEFGTNTPSYQGYDSISLHSEGETNYSDALKSLLQKSIDVLDLLTLWQREKLKGANITTLEVLLNKSEDELIANIYQVGPHRARLMKNAANAEILEYISG
ncbi:hypothetical protein NQ805_13430, partial [Acinetobacter baumannii]|nr:hypothetical protein [Acinetobacter baumannii]